LKKCCLHPSVLQTDNIETSHVKFSLTKSLKVSWKHKNTVMSWWSSYAARRQWLQ